MARDGGETIITIISKLLSAVLRKLYSFVQPDVLAGHFPYNECVSNSAGEKKPAET